MASATNARILVRIAFSSVLGSADGGAIAGETRNEPERHRAGSILPLRRSWVDRRGNDGPVAASLWQPDGRIRMKREDENGRGVALRFLPVDQQTEGRPLLQLPPGPDHER
jgi:hypothetical protein